MDSQKLTWQCDYANKELDIDIKCRSHRRERQGSLDMSGTAKNNENVLRQISKYMLQIADDSSLPSTEYKAYAEN